MPKSLKPLALLPNKPGFRFMGAFKDGTFRDCVTVLKDGLHTVEDFSELVGWLPLNP